VRFAKPRPYADPEVAMKKLLEIANSVEPIQDGRITYYQCRGAQGQHDDGILFPLFQFSIHTPFTQKTAVERAS